ncbi:MAG TPA: hypothetical protein ENJ82_12855, partial [Bacteroidetes bacterium]|nr:hypothetical protein [Bacteroidota bacterium]
MRRNLYAIVFALLCFAGNQAFGQLNLFWEELGPNNMGNHTRALAVDASGTVWAGSVGGGLWKSTNDGFTWEQVSGVSDNLAVSSIAIDGNNIYVGTGETFFFEPSNTFVGSNWKPDSTSKFKEGFHQYSGQPGEGVFVSNDGGATWSHNNGTWGPSSTRYEGSFISIQKIAASNGRVFIATLEGLYWSDNANLSSITKCTGTQKFEDLASVDIEFASNNIVIAATKDSVYRSTNNGTSFGSAINDSIFSGGSPPNNRIGGDRIEIAVAPSDPNIVYVTGASGINGNCTGVWRSADAGITWTRIAPFESATFQPFQGKGLYSCAMVVNQTNPNEILLGGEKLYSYNEANGWDDAASHSFIPGISTRYVPTPILSIATDPTDDSTLYIGTDAEIVRSDNFSTTYSFKTKGFNNAHLYGISAGVTYNVLVSDRFHGLLFKNNANGSPNLQQFNDIYPTTGSGIGRIVTTNPEFMISQTTDGGLVRSFNKGAAFEPFYAVPLIPIHPSFGTNPDSIFIDRPDSATGGGGLYDKPVLPVNAWCMDEYIPSVNLSNDTAILNTPIYIYLCSRHFVWVCTNPFGGVDSLPHWNRITPNLTKDALGKREFLSAIAVSGDAAHTVYVGTNFGKIFRIEDANDPINMDLNTKVTRVDTGQTNALPRRGISDIEFDHSNPDNLIVTYGSYENSDDRVYITNNAKATNPSFRSIQGNLQANLPVYCVGFDPDPNRK